MIRLSMLKCFFVVLLSANQLSAQTDDVAPELKVELDEIDTKFVDETGKPIAGVTARIYAMRSEEDSGSHYGWPTGNAGPSPQLTSDADGTVVFRYPPIFGSPENWKHTKQLSLYVSHPNYVSDDLSFDLDKWPKQITLERGCELRVSGVYNDGSNATRTYPFITGKSWNATWKRDGSTLVTNGLSPENVFFLLIGADDGRVSFSKLMTVEPSTDRPTLLDRVELMPGCRVYGELPAEVQRPIVDGTVHIHALLESGEPLAGREPITWDAWCPIQEDGSFELSSIPGPAQLQMFAICRGWVIKRPTPEFFHKGKVFDLKANQSELKVDLEMEKTGSITVELINPQGESIVGAQVATWPNQKLLSGGSTILCSKRDSLLKLERSMLENQLAEKPTGSRYLQRTDDEGRATLHDVPVNVKNGLTVTHPEYFFSPAAGAKEDETTEFIALEGENTERLLILDKRERKQQPNARPQ